MNESYFGIIGLGVMGKNLALNVLDRGHSLSVFNRTTKGEEHFVSDFLQEYPNHALQGFSSLKDFIRSLQKPRKILVMVKSGSAIDELIESLVPLLTNGDTVIDGGNSHYKDTIRRSEKLASLGLHFIGCGISGGEEGARMGPSIMPGGIKQGYETVAPLLKSIAAQDKHGEPCCEFIGPDGSGHFVKMIHNGVEYAEMQLLAEVYHLLSLSKQNDEIATILDSWSKEHLGSYLLEITIDILRKKEGSNYLLDLILDKAENKGTGSWSGQAAMELGMPASMITDALFARYLSSFKEQRENFGMTREQKVSFDLVSLRDSYQFGRLINHIQGFELLQTASKNYAWNLDLSSIARIWTNGCIIRSTLMESLSQHLNESKKILSNPSLVKQLKVLASGTSELLKQGIANSVPLPTLSSSYQYWLGMTTSRLPANLIQAQRDYFGAHRYQRIDGGETEYFHTNWKE